MIAGTQEPPLPDDGGLPWLLGPTAIDNEDLFGWLADKQDFVREKLHDIGGILFRGFPLNRMEHLARIMECVSGPLLAYEFGSTPRTHLKKRIYSSTEFPPELTIPLHNELSYTRKWPMKLGFLCLTPPLTRGETPIADSRRIYERIPDDIRRKFIEKRILYIRNYDNTLDVPWQAVFRTRHRSEVEAYCRRRRIEFEWKSDGGLRTREICNAVARHPITEEIVWFNQAHLFHVSNLPADLSDYLIETLGEKNVPRNAFYGDGSTIESEALALIRDAYEEETILFTWRTGDLLLLDNMLAAHGRRPYSGHRTIVVAMGEPCRV